MAALFCGCLLLPAVGALSVSPSKQAGWAVPPRGFRQQHNNIRSSVFLQQLNSQSHSPNRIMTGSTAATARQRWRLSSSISSSSRLNMIIFSPAEMDIASSSADVLATMSNSISSDFSASTFVAAAAETMTSSSLFSFWNMDQETAEALAGPFFGFSLAPYLAFLYFLSREENECPKGVTVGFATCLLFVFLTIPAAIAAKVLYGVSLADSDWLHGSAESLLTMTNLVTVVAFRQALAAKEAGSPIMPVSATSYAPMAWLVAVLTAVAAATALVPAADAATSVHTPYLGGILDLPPEWSMANTFGPDLAFDEPANALTVACWIIHISSLVEFLVAMGFCWKWADEVDNPTWKGLTWGLLPLHSSGITACTYHLFYNRFAALVPLQALLTCVGNTTAAIAAYRIARSNGWKFDEIQLPKALSFLPLSSLKLPKRLDVPVQSDRIQVQQDESIQQSSSSSLVGFEDLGQALSADTDYLFLIKLFLGCAVASYAIKYGETFFDSVQTSSVGVGVAVIAIPSALNAFKWYKRSEDATFEGWF